MVNWIDDQDNTITKTSLFKYTDTFTTKKWKFSDKNSDIFHITAQNIDCGYSLEPGEAVLTSTTIYVFSRNKKNNVYPCKPQFYYIKVGFNGGQNYIGMFSWCGESLCRFDEWLDLDEFDLIFQGYCWDQFLVYQCVRVCITIVFVPFYIQLNTHVEASTNPILAYLIHRTTQNLTPMATIVSGL